MTPRVLRAPEITPQDLEPKDTGTMQTPQSPSLEALIRDADREDALARARTLPTNVTAQLPAAATAVTPTLGGAEEVTFVPAPKALAQPAPAANNPGAQAVNVSSGEPPVMKPAVDNATANNTNAAPATNNAAAPAAVAAAPAAAESTAELLLMTDRQELKVGERSRVMVFLKTDAPLGLATATLRFDPKALAVRSVTQGGLTGAARPSSRSP